MLSVLHPCTQARASASVRQSAQSPTRFQRQLTQRGGPWTWAAYRVCDCREPRAVSRELHPGRTVRLARSSTSRSIASSIQRLSPLPIRAPWPLAGPNASSPAMRTNRPLVQGLYASHATLDPPALTYPAAAPHYPARRMRPSPGHSSRSVRCGSPGCDCLDRAREPPLFCEHVLLARACFVSSVSVGLAGGIRNVRP